MGIIGPQTKSWLTCPVPSTPVTETFACASIVNVPNAVVPANPVIEITLLVTRDKLPKALVPATPVG